MLTVVTLVEVLGIMVVQLTMLTRLLSLSSLALSTTWTAELLAGLTLSVLFTALALLVLLALRPWRKSKSVPAELAED